MSSSAVRTPEQCLLEFGFSIFNVSGTQTSARAPFTKFLEGLGLSLCISCPFFERAENINMTYISILKPKYIYVLLTNKYFIINLDQEVVYVHTKKCASLSWWFACCFSFITLVSVVFSLSLETYKMAFFSQIVYGGSLKSLPLCIKIY